ncbi:PorP/SprF family type IX secretion system membrane protein [Arcticibacter sp. MXS-1]|uniref:PorP/SprF family type IX secretion system membrane protein n=1 Tax=Arcticibacter sp. MXS-1 TaxID=3341726 RepID=UPI0035A92273
MKNIICKTLLAVIALILVVHSGKAQQQFSYTQFTDNLTPINPAWSLTVDGGAINLLARKQWVGIEGAPQSYMFNGHLPIKSIGGAAGIMVMRDQVAVENLNEVNLFFAKAVQLNANTYFSVAMNGGFRNYRALYSGLDPNDPLMANSDIGETEGNIGASVMVYNPEKFYVGVSLPRLSIRDLGKGSVASSRYLKKFYYLSFGGYLPLEDQGMRVSLASLVAYTANVPLQADLSAKLFFGDSFGVGMNYRTNNELAALTSLVMGSVRVAYSYQFGFGRNKVGSFTGATHEVTTSFYFNKSFKPLF